MNVLDYLLPATNTLLLLILFFYQRNRNKILEDQLAAQSRLIDETKSVVTQQAAAVDSQAKVVDAALKYTNAFDPKKLEDTLRREIVAEHRDEVNRLKSELETKSKTGELGTEEAMRLIDMLAEAAGGAAASAILDFIKPFLPHTFRSLLAMPPDSRVSAVANIEPEKLRTSILAAVAEIERKQSELTKQENSGGVAQ